MTLVLLVPLLIAGWGFVHQQSQQVALSAEERVAVSTALRGSVARSRL